MFHPLILLTTVYFPKSSSEFEPTEFFTDMRKSVCLGDCKVLANQELCEENKELLYQFYGHGELSEGDFLEAENSPSEELDLNCLCSGCALPD